MRFWRIKLKLLDWDNFPAFFYFLLDLTRNNLQHLLVWTLPDERWQKPPRTEKTLESIKFFDEWWKYLGYRDHCEETWMFVSSIQRCSLISWLPSSNCHCPSISAISALAPAIGIEGVRVVKQINTKNAIAEIAAFMAIFQIPVTLLFLYYHFKLLILCHNDMLYRVEEKSFPDGIFFFFFYKTPPYFVKNSVELNASFKEVAFEHKDAFLSLHLQRVFFFQYTKVNYPHDYE